VFLITVIASLTSPSVMALPRIVARAFPTDCKTATGCTSVAELHQQQGSSTHRQASSSSAIPPRPRARHFRQPTSYLYHSPKRSHQDQQPQLGYSGQHGSRAHLRSWLPRARRPCTPRPPRAVFRSRLDRELPKRVISVGADSKDQRDSRQCKWGWCVSWPALEPGQSNAAWRSPTVAAKKGPDDGDGQCELRLLRAARVPAYPRTHARSSTEPTRWQLLLPSFNLVLALRADRGPPAQQTPLLMSR
jgi:hypothetical protein